MSTLLPTLVPALGWALLDFLWQGAAIGLAAVLVLAALRDARPQARYAVACAALALCALLPLGALLAGLATATDASPVHASPRVAAALAEGGARMVAFDADGGWRALLQGRLAWIVASWSLGAGLFAVRLVAGIAWVGDVRERARPVDAAWQRRLDALARAVGVTRGVRLATATQVDGPVTAGWWRPVVLLPATLLTRLPPDYIEALLAHELAHIRRHDYLVNLVQGAIEALLFYHPVVWWLSRRIRVERELIADDLALRAIGQPQRLARALQQLDLYQASRRLPALPSSHQRLLPAAHGGKLMSRIQRLVIRPQVGAADWRFLVPLAGLALVAVSVFAKTPAPAVAPLAPVASHAASAPAAWAPAAVPSVSATPAVAPVAPLGAVSATPRVAPTPAVAAVAPVARPWPTPSTPMASVAAVAPVARISPVAMVSPVSRVAPVAMVSPIAAVAAVAAPSPVARSTRDRDGTRLPYALVREGEDGMMLSGSLDDVADVKATRQHLHGDFLWFRRAGTDYVVQDPAVLARARQAWAPSEALGAKMEAIAAQMEPHSKKMEALGKQMEVLSKRSEPFRDDMERASRGMEPIGEKQRVLGERMGKVGERMAFAKNEAEREQLQREMDTLQAQMEPLSAQMQKVSVVMEKHAAEMRQWHEPMAALGKQMDEAGAPMKPLAEKMRVLGDQQEGLTMKADAEVQALIDQSLREGKALPARTIR